MTNDITTADEGENLRKQYENMSYNEMSLKLAENYKQLQELLGNRISIPTTEESSDYDEDDDEEEEQVDIEQQQKEEKTKLFLKSVSSGDVEKVKYYLEQEIDDIDINGKDEDGTTPLIYAACFGKFEISQLLLSAGANIDNQDAHGWSALMWATTNNHEKLVKLLLENGASSQTKSAKGRTVLDFVKNDTHKIADMVIASSISNRDSISSTSSIMGFTAAGSNSSASSNAGDNDRYYQYSTEENYETFITHDSESRPKLIEEYLLSTNNNNGQDSDSDDDYSENDNDNDSEEEDIKLFDWDKCMPDQMFVFGADNLPYILDTVISKLTLPIRNVQEIFLPANVVFLSARFAHYYSSAELAEDVMEGALHRISLAIKSNTQNVHILSYWMTNITRLLYYLKKDVQLVVATAEYQLRLSELISETYNHIVNDTGKRITQILEPSMLEHDPISGMMDEVNFVDDWQRFFRRSNSKSEDMQRTNSSQLSSSQNSSNTIIVMSPKTIIQLFSSTYYVLQSYEVHSTIIIQAIAQFLHLLSCELFNQILSKRKYLCRSKAIQIRMNLSVIEEWIRNNNLPASLISYLNPSIQLVQLLQCISQLDNVSSFQSTIKLFDSINSLQIRRCVINYRYETNEPRLPEEIERLVQQTFDETIRLKQARQSRSFERRRRSGPPLLNNHQSQSLRRSLSNRAESNITQFMGSILLSRSSITADEKPLALPDQDEEVEDKEINETKDARFMLPFFVPTTAQLSVTKDEFLLIPVIPENWMDKLDNSEK
ncbi:hypothetical protein MFLAVUS_011367 [Mucor flavus]|uniref:Dilute domain-containing protein n=1 Tax=Mucor flavus TaxID=439312 RepID=A0ABP9ZFB3_9FUNG